MWDDYIAGATSIGKGLKSARFHLDKLIYARLRDLLSAYFTEKEKRLEK